MHNQQGCRQRRRLSLLWAIDHRLQPGHPAARIRRGCRGSDVFVPLPAMLLQPIGQRRVFDPRLLRKLWPAHPALVKFRQQRLPFFPGKPNLSA